MIMDYPPMRDTTPPDTEIQLSRARRMVEQFATEKAQMDLAMKELRLIIEDERKARNELEAKFLQTSGDKSP